MPGERLFLLESSAWFDQDHFGHDDLDDDHDDDPGYDVDDDDDGDD